MDLLGAIRWRYRCYVQPYRELYRDPVTLVRRYLSNRQAATRDHPIAYVYADPTNSGDYASYLGLRQLVGRPGVELFCAPVAIPSTLRALRACPWSGKRWDIVFVGGGGLLQRCFDRFWEGLLTSGAPFVLFGVGANQAGDYREVTPRALIRNIARGATAVHVRDQFTYKLVAPYRDEVTAVGVCPSVNYLAEACRAIPRSSTHLLHVIHDADVELAGLDLTQLRQRLRRLAGRMGLAYDETNHLVGVGPNLLRRYARAALVVSSRLHGCIFSYALDKPFLAIECDRKVTAFLETHLPNHPCLAASEALDHLSEDLLTGVARMQPSHDRTAKMANNVAVMSAIVRGLS